MVAKMMAGLIFLGAMAQAASCATSRVGRLRIECPQREASVFVDGKYLGRVKVLGDLDVQLPAGKHRIEIRQRGFYARYRTIRIQPNSVARLRLHLEPRLDWALQPRGKPSKRKPRKTKP